MFKLALAAPSIIRAQSSVFFVGYSNLLSYTNPTYVKTCSPSSPFWTDTFLTQNISIQSIFKDVKYGACNKILLIFFVVI